MALSKENFGKRKKNNAEYLFVLALGIIYFWGKILCISII
jgi:hypothetical protein